MQRLVLVFIIIAAAAPAAAAPKSASKKPSAAPRKPVVASNTGAARGPAPASARSTPATAVATPPGKPVAPRDSLEAALALAEANAAAPRVAPAPGSRRSAGLADLSKRAREAARIGLGPAPRSDLPPPETLVQMQARTVDQATIARVVRADMRALQYCHESLTARGVQCGGDLSLRFVIEPRGHVSGVKVSAGGANAATFEACIAARVKTWKFPAADAPTTVSYPLVLERSGAN